MYKMMRVKCKETVLFFTDSHNPCQHPDLLEFLLALKKKIKPTMVIHGGDFSHQASYGHFFSSGDAAWKTELESAKESLKPFMKAFPNLKVLEGNHDRRLVLRRMEAHLPSIVPVYKEIQTAFGFPKGWTLHQRLIVDGVLYRHGDPYTGKQAIFNALTDWMGSVVFGHIHAHAGVYWQASNQCLLFSLNSGCSFDINHSDMKWERDRRFKGIVGASIIAKGYPVFIPMALGKHGRWTGELPNYLGGA